MKAAIVAPIVVASVGLGVLALYPRKKPTPPKPAPVAPAELKAFVTKNEKVKDKKVQDQVTRARMTLAYQAAKTNDFATARASFQEAAIRHEGSQVQSADFGSVSDQAAYQAIVCLVGEGKKDEAAKDFRKFIEDRPLSPLVHACHQRLVRLGVRTEADDRLLQAAITKQETNIRFELSVCGPKAIEKILPILGQPTKSYKELAKLCGTTDQGTTIDGMRKCLRTLGLESYPLSVNKTDFLRLKPPFIYLHQDHYVAVIAVSGTKATAFDSLRSGEIPIDLSKADETSFQASVIAFSLPTSFAKP
jgi:hypothetical protein